MAKRIGIKKKGPEWKFSPVKIQYPMKNRD